MGNPNQNPDNSGNSSSEPRAVFDILAQLKWSLFKLPEQVRRRSDERVMAILGMPRAREMEDGSVSFDPAVVAAAYYATELATKLPPFDSLFVTPPETNEKEEEIKAYIAALIASELVQASRLYSGLRIDRRVHKEELTHLHINVSNMTDDRSPRNDGILSALHRMSQSNAHRPYLGDSIGDEAQYLIRMLMAKERGKIEDYPDLLIPHFSEEDLLGHIKPDEAAE